SQSAQGIPEPPVRSAANRRGNGPPFQEGFMGPRHRCFIILRPSGEDRGDRLAVDRRRLFKGFAVAEPFAAKHAWVYLLDSRMFQPAFHSELAIVRKAAEDCRTPRPSEFRGVALAREASWSAPVLCRFSFDL